MAYLKNDEFQLLAKMWTEARDNHGYISFNTLQNFGALLRKIEHDKSELREKTKLIYREKRKENKQYGRKKVK